MKKPFLVTATMTVSCFLEVEAEDAEQARDLAASAPLGSWDVDKDGEPENLTVEESK